MFTERKKQARKHKNVYVLQRFLFYECSAVLIINDDSILSASNGMDKEISVCFILLSQNCPKNKMRKANAIQYLLFIASKTKTNTHHHQVIFSCEDTYYAQESLREILSQSPILHSKTKCFLKPNGIIT